MQRPKHCFWFTYHATGREDRAEELKDSTRQIHRVRDGLAFAELMPLLSEEDYRYGGALLNLPQEYFGPEQLPDAVPAFDSSDLVVGVTRPPLNDPDNRRKQIRQSGTDLEQEAVFPTLRNYFLEQCDRYEIQLHSQLRTLLEDKQHPAANRASLCFKERTPVAKVAEGAKQANLPKENATCGYLFFAPHMGTDRPSLLFLFGLGAIETLTWARFLGSRGSQLLAPILRSEKLHAVMSEWSVLSLPKRPTSLACLDCHIDILFHASSSLTDPLDWTLE